MGQRWDKLRGTSSPAFSVGNGRAGNKSFQASIREHAPPEVRWNDSLPGWEFTEDGVRFFPIGTHFIPAVYAGMSAGLFGYLHPITGAVHRTDASSSASSRCVGAHVGVAGRLMTCGVVPAAVFSLLSDVPAFGSPVFLARNDDEVAGAAGKVSTKEPASGAVAQVGIVGSVDPITFPSTRTASVLLQVKSLRGIMREGIIPVGSIDSVNQVFRTTEPFVHEVGRASVRVYYNGQRLVLVDDYTVSASGGFGAGYDTVTLQGTKPPKPGDRIWVDYTADV